ncbi:MAG: cobalamin-dependent protein, partial [Candidatus Omnitrophota bacterium]
MNADLDKRTILLINPCSRAWWWNLPALGLGYIASSLERIGIRVKIIDCQVTSSYRKEIAKFLNHNSIVGISSNSGTISSALETSNLIRQHSPSTRIIFGGPHSTAIYDK